MKKLTRRALVVLLCASSAAACSIEETHYEEVIIPLRPKREIVTCNSPFTKPDLGSLKPCGGKGRGDGHCYDASKVPAPKSEFEACEGNEICVPDTLLKAAGAKAKSCTFFYNGKPGACLSLVYKRVNENKDALKQDTCAENERCLPCIDPTNGMDTALCGEMGVHEAACVGGPGDKPTPCCHKMGTCILPDAVPEEARAGMVPETCKGGKLCAPNSQLDSKPVMCEFLGAKGICLDVCFAEQMKGMTSLTRGGCGPTELCMPCALANAMGGSQHLVGCG
jgi:hypothetical protein